MRQRHISCSGYIRLALIAILVASPLVRAQDVTESALKAAFIYNLAKFTQWPEETPAPRSFSMCVLGDAAVGEALVRSVRGRLLSGNSISVTRLSTPGSFQGCRLLYLSGVTKEQAAEIVASVRGTPVLTISDLDGFTELGGVVQFFFERGQLRFRVGLESAKRSRLPLSAKILTLAVIK